MSIPIIFGAIGLVVISYAIWLRSERKQDVLFAVGGILLLVYSMSIHDTIFIVLQIVFIVSALVEMLRLYNSKKKF